MPIEHCIECAFGSALLRSRRRATSRSRLEVGFNSIRDIVGVGTQPALFSFRAPLCHLMGEASKPLILRLGHTSAPP